MTTKRNKVLEDSGSIFIQNIVRENNCIFQEVDLKNDQGNDCYIEFITDNVATSFCVFAQIKSGKSYKDKSGYKIPADQNHLNYWSNHTNPVVGIVFDEQSQEAFWVNITEYLFKNPEVMEQSTHAIRISPNNKFSDFISFKNHFTEYIQEYKSFENYGRSLDSFAQVDNPPVCYDGFKSLYSNHRNRPSAWFFIISNFGKISEPGIHRNILGVMSNFVPSDDILWTKDNLEFLQKENIKREIAKCLSKSFGKQEVEMAIEFIREGVVRGSYNYSVYKVLSLIDDVHNAILEITYTESDPNRRDFDFWLFVHFSQWKSKDSTLDRIDEYFEKFPEADQDRIIAGLREAILDNDPIPIG